MSTTSAFRARCRSLVQPSEVRVAAPNEAFRIDDRKQRFCIRPVMGRSQRGTQRTSLNAELRRARTELDLADSDPVSDCAVTPERVQAACVQ